MMPFLWILGIIVGVVFVIYMLAPNLYARHFSEEVIKNIDTVDNDKKICLTFDDGPNDCYTPLFLEVLRQYHIKATFFVVGCQVEKFPEILKQILADGHEIGLHTQKHKGQWQSFPWESVQELTKTKELIERAANHQRIHFYRPPWGTFNAVTLRTAKSLDLKTILWSRGAHDWQKNNTPVKIAGEIMCHITPGDIIVLHDHGGAEGAPLRTLEALKLFIPKLKVEGYQFVTLQEGIGHGK